MSRTDSRNTTDAPESPSQAAPSAAVTFVSRSPNFTLYLQSPTPVAGVGGAIEYKGGKAIRFQNHRYTTSDAEEIAGMRRSGAYRRQFQEVDAPAPLPGTTKPRGAKPAA